MNSSFQGNWYFIRFWSKWND